MRVVKEFYHFQTSCSSSCFFFLVAFSRFGPFIPFFFGFYKKKRKVNTYCFIINILNSKELYYYLNFVVVVIFVLPFLFLCFCFAFLRFLARRKWYILFFFRFETSFNALRGPRPRALRKFYRIQGTYFVI